jgi:hypothetical protein
MLAKSAHTWRFLTPAPPREVFSVMEQLLGTSPYRFEVLGDDRARIVEYQRRGLFGAWGRVRLRPRWVSCEARPIETGTQVTVESSTGGGLVAKAMGRADRGPITRGLQLVKLLTAGIADSRTIYRERRIPPGPVSLVASWAGTPYALFTEPRYDASRGAEILTATEIQALPGGTGTFVHVRLGDGTEGYVERDQIVAAPAISTREAQAEAAAYV